MDSSTHILSSGAEVWRDLIDRQLIKLTTYDRDLEREIAESLGLAQTKPFLTELERDGIPSRDLLRALIIALQPVSVMLNDLVKFYSAVGANSSGGDFMVIRYEFDEGDCLDILLQDFRLRVQRLQDKVNDAIGLPASQNDFWEFPYRAAVQDRAPQPEVEDWRRTNVVNRDFMSTPPRPATGATSLDNELRRVWLFFDAYMTATRRHASNWRDLEARSLSDTTNEPEELTVLWITHSDYWIASSVLGVFSAIQRGEDPAVMTAALRDWLSGLPVSQVTDQELLETAADLLGLPMWGKRHDLYAAWIASQIEASLPSRLTYRVTNGVLAFPFSGACLATLDTASGTAQFWAELRSPMQDPVGSGRSANIQPDYRFYIDNSAVAATTVVAIEAKQYHRSAYKVHADAVVDYANGLPNSGVVLAAYGKVSKNVEGRLSHALAGRVRIVREFRPGNTAPFAEFRTCLQDALPSPVPSSGPETSAQQYELTMSWSGDVEDVDLHAFVHGPDVQHIYYGNKKGKGIAVSDHTTNGEPQTVSIDEDFEWENHVIAVWVNPYTSGSSLASAQPELKISGQGADPVILLPSSPPATSDAWHVCNIQSDGHVEIIDTYSPLRNLV